MSSIVNFARNNPKQTGLIGLGIAAVSAIGYYIYRSRCQQLVGPHWETDVNAEKFHQAITAAKANNAFGAFVHAYSQEIYQGMSLYLLNDGSKKGVAGVAVTSDGDIVSVFKHPDCSVSGVALKYLIPKALANGGRKLDCFNGFLPGHYAKLGFVPTSKVKFNDEFAPEDWNYARDKRPDIVFMKYHQPPVSTDGLSELVQKRIQELEYSGSYEEAQQVQSEF